MDEGGNLLVARVEEDDHVVVPQPADLDHLPCLRVPAELIAEDHDLPHQRFQLGNGMAEIEDILLAVAWVIGVVTGQSVGSALRIGQRLGHRGVARGDVDAGAPTAANHFDQEPEDGVFQPCIPGGRQGAVGGFQDAGERSGVTRRDAGKVDVGLSPRRVSPAGRTLLVHRQGVPVAPVEIRHDVA